MRRRELLTAALAGVSAGVLSPFRGRAAGDTTGGTRQLNVAGYDYDRVRAIMDGRAGVPGAEVLFEFQDIYSVNQFAFGPERKYEVSELGLIPYLNKFANEGFRAYTLIPVFISRTFRHRNVFVRADAGIEKPEDLRGKRVGTPGYGMSANTWIRGFLLDEYGVKPDEMQWIETTKSSDQGALGRSGWSAFDESGSRSRYFLPPDFPLAQGPAGVDESELLLSGGCDALITAITPKAFLEGHPKIRRLFPDVRAAERAYFEKTGLFPIMHAVGIRTDAIEADPALPKAVFEMYSRAKQLTYEQLESTTVLRVTLPWLTQEFEETRALMGRDYWSYGVEANRAELERVARYTHEQGLVKRRLTVDEVFHPSTLELSEG